MRSLDRRKNHDLDQQRFEAADCFLECARRLRTVSQVLTEPSVRESTVVVICAFNTQRRTAEYGRRRRWPMAGPKNFPSNHEALEPVKMYKATHAGA